MTMRGKQDRSKKKVPSRKAASGGAKRVAKKAATAGAKRAAGAASGDEKSAKKSGKKSAKKGAARDAIVKPLLAKRDVARAQWARYEERIRRLREEGAEAFDELWEVVDEVMSADPPLYLGGGMKSEDEFIARMLPGEDRRSVTRNRLVALAFTPDDEATLGVKLLEEIARYVMELSGSTALPRAVDLDRLRIAVHRGDRTVRKVARECSFAEVHAARVGLGKMEKRPATPAESSIRRALSKTKALADVKVSAPRDVLTFTGVPLGAVHAFARALSALPADALAAPRESDR